jgi:hypothetical protein
MPPPERRQSDPTPIPTAGRGEDDERHHERADDEGLLLALLLRRFEAVGADARPLILWKATAPARTSP